VTTAAGAYLHEAEEGELRWMGETSTYFLATGEQTGGAFALIDEQGKRGQIDGSQIKQASQEYGVEFGGPLPDETEPT